MPAVVQNRFALDITMLAKVPQYVQDDFGRACSGRLMGDE
jgi:hypothetical protein